MRSSILLVACLLIATAAGAHPGHGGTGDSLGVVHYLSEPIHALGAITLVCAGLAGAYLLRRRAVALARNPG